MLRIGEPECPIPIHPDGLSANADPRLANSFENFLYMVWRSLGLPEPTPLQYEVARWLQYGPMESTTMGFRGLSKTYIAVPFGLWCLYRNRDLKILLVSATGGFASRSSYFAFSMLTNFDWLQWLQPRKDQKQSANEFEVAGAASSKDPSFASEGLYGQITGRRADVIIADDIEIPNTSDTETSRESLDHRSKEFAAIGAGKLGKKALIGTAQCEDTVYLKRESEGFVIRIWPLSYPANSKELLRYGGRLAPSITDNLEENPSLAGTSTEPSRFTAADIAKLRLLWGKIEFNRQFLMHIDAGNEDSKPLKMRDLMVMDIDPEQGLPSKIAYDTSPDQRFAKTDIPIDALTGDSTIHHPRLFGDETYYKKPEKVVCTIDPSGSGKDETTWTIAGEMGGKIFIMWQGASLKGTSAPVLEAIAKDCKTWGVNLIEIESNFGQDMLEDLLAPALKKEGVKATITMERAGAGFKEARIIQHLEPVTTGHRLVINAALLRKDYTVPYIEIEDAKKRFYRLTYQLSRLEKVKGSITHDDRIEGVSTAVKHFSYVLRQAEEDIADRAAEETILEEYRKMELYRAEHGLPPLNPDHEDNPVPKQGRSKLVGIGGAPQRPIRKGRHKI